MAPRTRRSAQRLAVINAEYAKDTLPQPVVQSEQLEGEFTDKSEKPHNDNEDEHVEAGPSRSNPARLAKSTKKRDFRDPHVAFSAQSKLTEVDLAKFFIDEKAWTTLTSEQQAILKGMCAKDSAWGKSDMEQPTLEVLAYDMHWKSDVRAYSENLANGYYDPAWIQEAERATSNRNEGKFDDWKLKNFEQYWGQKMDPERKELGGKKQMPALSDLVAQEILRIGDGWSYSRSFGRGTNHAVIEHKFQMTGIDDYGKVQFRICLPTSTTNLKRFFDDIENEDQDRDGRIPKRIKYGKQVKIVVDDSSHIEEQSSDVSFLPASPTKPQSDTAGNDSNPSGMSANNSNNSTTQRARSLSADDQSVEMTIHASSSRTANQPTKSILKKPSMVMFSLIATEVEELEDQLLKHSGYNQASGKADVWKFFTVNRGDQSIGSLQTLRNEYWEKLES